MNIKNFEFKAKVEGLDKYEQMLLELNPLFIGTDHQVDTYFNVSHGRLKLREGNIENALIDYEREDTAGSKLSEIILYKYKPDSALKKILAKQFGIKTVVDKKRKIYFIDQIKFHFDEVESLGTFIEVEAIDNNGLLTIGELKEQCDFYLHFFKFLPQQLIEKSYSDLLEEKMKQNS
ncbi:MAG: class IV adenylate cyclase [Ginsengibacter sp.]